MGLKRQDTNRSLLATIDLVHGLFARIQDLKMYYLVAFLCTGSDGMVVSNMSSIKYLRPEKQTSGVLCSRPNDIGVNRAQTSVGSVLSQLGKNVVAGLNL